MDESGPTRPGGRPRGRRSGWTRRATGSRPPGGRARRRGSRTTWPRPTRPTGRRCWASWWRWSASCAGAAASGRRPRSTWTGSRRHAEVVRAAFGAAAPGRTIGRRRPPRDAGRDLLFGVLALQNNFIGRDDLLAAFAAWVADKARPLGRILVDRGALDDARRALLEALVAEHLKQHGGDTEASLAAVSSLGSVPRRPGAARRPRPPGQPRRHDLAGRRGRRRRRGDGDLHRPRPAAPARGSASSASTARAAWARSTSPATRSSAARWRSRRSGPTRSPRPTSAAGSSSRPRSTAGWSTPGSCRSTAWAPTTTAGRSTPCGSSRGTASRRRSRRTTRSTPGPTRARVEFRKLLGRFVDVCEAIAFAHSKGVLHRDLKPHNVMLGRYGETLLIDWGLAKATGRREPVGPEAAGEATLVPASGSGHAPTRRACSARRRT